MLSAISGHLPDVLLLPTMRPLVTVLVCPVICLVLCAATDGLIAACERLMGRRHRRVRVIELKPANADWRQRAGMRTV